MQLSFDLWVGWDEMGWDEVGGLSEFHPFVTIRGLVGSKSGRFCLLSPGDRNLPALSAPTLTSLAPPRVPRKERC